MLRAIPTGKDRRIVARRAVVGDGGHPAEDVLERAPAQAHLPGHALDRRDDRRVAPVDVGAPFPVVGVLLVTEVRIQVELEVIMRVREPWKGDGALEIERCLFAFRVPRRTLADPRNRRARHDDVLDALAVADPRDSAQDHVASAHGPPGGRARRGFLPRSTVRRVEAAALAKRGFPVPAWKTSCPSSDQTKKRSCTFIAVSSGRERMK